VNAAHARNQPTSHALCCTLVSQKHLRTAAIQPVFQHDARHSVHAVHLPEFLLDIENLVPNAAAVMHSWTGACLMMSTSASRGRNSVIAYHATIISFNIPSPKCDVVQVRRKHSRSLTRCDKVLHNHIQHYPWHMVQHVVPPAIVVHDYDYIVHGRPHAFPPPACQPAGWQPTVTNTRP